MSRGSHRWTRISGRSRAAVAVAAAGVVGLVTVGVSNAGPVTMNNHTPPPADASQPAHAAAGKADHRSADHEVLAEINRARAADHLPPLTVTRGLTRSATKHNHLMGSGCGMSHQCPGEPSLGDRVTAAGVHWMAVGENIGEMPSGPRAGQIASAAVGLTKAMLAEKPPNDGHRKNILSRSFRHVGIAVHRSANGTVWLTQDFSN
ncbi:hypothetical protein GCM10010211_08550 [Streptomyces albospinus]|uniref:SCP domain-containing protein n=1 Tax=Streptomyces albospinus TaxID=285515 RepID=A0ABQ2UQW3_9ACTN|nr:CAP domain-containing protein [Streptomyces albospinus]GGU47080.1 hypothetical protein GCM10010211_08550 [Streptomyces albospinus]